MPDSAQAFAKHFTAAARTVRLRLGLAYLATGLSLGALTAALTALAAALSRHPRMVAPALALLLPSAFVGAWIGRRRRLADQEVALLLDHRLKSREVVTTALECLASAHGSPQKSLFSGVILARASDILGSAPKAALRVPVLRPVHGVLPLGVLGLVLAMRMHRAELFPNAPVPGVEAAGVADVIGLDDVSALRKLDPRDDAQRDRLRALADEAERIRQKMRDGAPQREVKADVAKLADAVAAERMSFGSGEERRGLEAAMSELGKNSELGASKNALGDHDMVAFDSAMQRAANQAERASRVRARQSLEDAEKAARSAGAEGVAKSLAEQGKRFDDQSQQSARMRELAKSLGSKLDPSGREALQSLDKTGDPQQAKKLAEALDKALASLSDAQRKALADALKRQVSDAEEGEPSQRDRKTAEDLAKELASPDGAKALENQLKALADSKEGSAEAGRQRALEAAEGSLHGGGKEGPAVGGTSSGDGSPGVGSRGDDGSPRASLRGGGATQTPHSDATEMRAHASSEVRPGVPLPGVVAGRTSARTGETANARGAGALGHAAAEQVSGVSKSDVPEEYREQVGRYFEP